MKPEGPNPSGLCQCGCGRLAPISTTTSPRWGRLKGKATRYLQGHNRRRGPEYIVDPVTGCHIWQGAKTPDGYGQLHVKGRTLTAHLHFYEKKYGPVPPGKELDHFKCDNRACCNADHVRPVTHTENIRRSRATKLTLREAQEIRCLGAAPGGIAPLDLGTIYGVTRATIYDVLTGRRNRWSAEEAA